MGPPQADAGTGVEVFKFRGHAGGVAAAGFSPDGLRVATRDGAGMVREWDAGPPRPAPPVAPPPWAVD